MLRMWGFVLDYIVEVEVVIVDGKIQRVSVMQNEDFFWVFRGFVFGFGVIIEFVVRIYFELVNVVQYEYIIKFGKQVDVVFLYLKWQVLMVDFKFDCWFGFMFIMFFFGVIIIGIFYGIQEEFLIIGIFNVFL